MTDAAKTGATPLGALVRQGDVQTEADRIGQHDIWMVRDVSNAFLVRTSDGDVMVNTGFMDNAARNKNLFSPVRSGRLTHIILTQSHPDHYGCVPDFKEDGTEIIGGPDFVQNWQEMIALQPFFKPRSFKLWGQALNRGANPLPPPDVFPDRTIPVAGSDSFTQGGKTFELIHTPEGETTDGLCVWMPQEKVLFTGNLFGPVFGGIPNLNTVRGDKPRLVRNFLKSAERIRDLGIETLITGHGEPVFGKAEIKRRIDGIYDVMKWLRDYVVSGLQAQKNLHQLMAEVALPDHLTIGEFHGKITWAVRAIYHEFVGWVRYEEGTSQLYHVRRQTVDKDLVELIGGAEPLALKAGQYIKADKPLEAIHLADIALSADPANKSALNMRLRAHQMLLEKAGGVNLSETMWLRSEIREMEAKLA